MKPNSTPWYTLWDLASLWGTPGSTGRHFFTPRTSMAHTSTDLATEATVGNKLVCFVYLVDSAHLVGLVHLVYPVSLVQQNKQDKPNKPINETGRTDQVNTLCQA